MAKTKSYGGLITLILVLAAGGGASWYYFKAPKELKPEFQTTKVARGDIIQAVTATGDLQPVQIVDISSQISGQVKEVLVDFNSVVKAGDVLAKIDESTYVQRLRQAEADLESAKANNLLVKVNAERTQDLFKKNLVSQSELDTNTAQLAQSNATLLTRTAAVENARLDLARCTITAPIDGIILDRRTDVGRTVVSSMNAPTLFTLVNNLSKMQINAAVAEADIGSIAEGQEVKFTVDAFPNRTFVGTVRQVRNAAAINQSVVSYGTIIAVDNDDLRLKPGMTANVSIIVSQRTNVLRVANSTLRVRLPAELQPPAPAAPATKADAKTDGAAPVLTDDETRRLTMEIITKTGFQPGSVATPDQIETARKLAKEAGLDPDLMVARLSTPRGQRGRGGVRGSGGGFGGGGNRGGGSTAPAVDRGFNNTIVTRTLYKIENPDAVEKNLIAVTARLGISDGFYTEVLEGLADGDTVLTGVRMPNAGSSAPAGGMANPFQGGRGMPGGGVPGGGARRG
jgi:HlyD family secretion protein